MKKILILILVLFSLNANSQYRRVLAESQLQIQAGQSNDISNFEAGFQVVLNEAVAVGGILPTIADQRLLNDIYITADAQGMFNGDFFYHYKNTGDFTFQSINWSDPLGVKSTDIGAGELVISSTGITTDGVNYLETNIIPTHTINNASLMIDILTAYTTNSSLIEADSTGLVSTLIVGNGYQYFNSNETNRVYATNSGTGFFSFSRDDATTVEIFKDGVSSRVDTYNSVRLPNESYKLLKANSSGRGDSKIGFFASYNSITGSELAIYNAIKNAPAVTTTGGIQSDGYIPLVLSGNYGTSTAGIFTFNKTSAEITEGVVSSTIARNNRDIISEAIRVAVEVELDSVFLFGDLDCYVDTGANQFRELTRVASIQSNYDGLRISGNYDTTILRMQPHSFIAGAIFNIYKASDMELSKMTLLGEKMLHDYSNPYTNAPHEFPSGIVLEGAPNMVIDSIISNDFTGDGLTVYHSESRQADGTPTVGSVITTNLLVKNCEFRRNRRNNISYVDVDGFILENSILDFAGEGGDYPYGTNWDWRGVLPRCNIDFEATRTSIDCVLQEGQRVINGVVRNNTFTRAWLSDLNFYTCSYIEVYGNTFTSPLAVPVYANHLTIYDNILTWDSSMSTYSIGFHLNPYTSECLIVNENGYHEIYNNTITGFDVGISVSDTGSNIYDNTIVDALDSGIIASGLDVTLTNNNVTNTAPLAKGIDMFAGGSTSENVRIIGGTIISPYYGADIRKVTGVGVGLIIDGVTFNNTIYIRDTDGFTLQNSTFPEPILYSGVNGVITLFNNNP